MKLRQFDIYPHTDGYEVRCCISVEKALNGFIICGTVIMPPGKDVE